MNKKALPVEENCGEELNCCMAISELEESLTDVPDSTIVVMSVMYIRTLLQEIWLWIMVRRLYFASTRFLLRWIL